MSISRLRLGVLALWLLASAILLSISWPNIRTLEMLDPDDYLRLQQVRDWLGGQSFFDVTQYRIDPPEGVPMHWSRIVDLPLAALILLLKPLLGLALAEKATAAIVPLITLGGSMIAIALIGARLADRRTALVAAMLAATTPLLLFHVMPLRIDHHGWQTMLGLFTLGACFDPKARRGGLTAGICAALWLAISLEALPMVAAIALVLAARFVVEGEAIRFPAFSAALAVAGALLFAAFHGVSAYRQPWCDAVSPAWFGPLILSPALAAIGAGHVARHGRVARLALLAAAGGAGMALLTATAPLCLGGPFASLDPFVRKYWYQNVVEGLPIWRQPIGNATLLIGFPPIGIAGAWFARRHAVSDAARRNWLAMLALMIAAFAVSLLVQRAGGFAHGCALAGAGWLLARMIDRIALWPRPALRILATATAIFALSPIGAMVTLDLAADAMSDEQVGAEKVPACLSPCDRFAAIARLPHAAILTGIDITPRLLVLTPHSFAGSGHHRDQAAIRRVMTAFMGSPEAARAMMMRHRMDYVLIDPVGAEAAIYGKAASHGLMARLLRGDVPAWLVPVPLGQSDLKMWRRVK